MSYCRWSDNDHRCDVYVYADCDGGWTTHVASNRYVFLRSLPAAVDLPEDFTEAQFNVWFEREQTVSAMCREASEVDSFEDIGLPHDGARFNDPTPAACADRLEQLRNLGYLVPQYAIDELRDEAEASA